MSNLASQITSALQVLVGQPLVDVWRLSNMANIGFGPQHRIVNRRGEEVEVAVLSIHLQCRWRVVDEDHIVFGRDDILYPADPSISEDEFDWDTQESRWDVARREWMQNLSTPPPNVLRVQGDQYGGFRIELEGGLALETFPCDSLRGESSEHWRLINDWDGTHTVVTGDGLEV